MRVAAATAFLPPLLPYEPKAEGGGCCHTHSKLLILDGSYINSIALRRVAAGEKCMTGIQSITDEKDQKVAAIIHFKKSRELRVRGQNNSIDVAT